MIMNIIEIELLRTYMYVQSSKILHMDPAKIKSVRIFGNRHAALAVVRFEAGAASQHVDDMRLGVEVRAEALVLAGEFGLECGDESFIRVSLYGDTEGIV